jgi:hypothetical protein
MAQFPIVDKSGIYDALNYVLSGPTSLGQEFAYYNSNGLEQWDLTGNYRLPFTQISYNPPHVPGVNLYVAPIALSTSEMLDEYTWKYTFATPYGFAPFINGQNVTVAGVADSYYDGTYTPIGVVECTDTYVIVKTQGPYAVVPPSTGGTVGLDSMNYAISTDCNGRVTVNGNSDIVSISNQINFELFADPSYVGSYYCNVRLNRYHGETNNDPTNPDYIFLFDKTIAYKEFLVPTTIVSHTIELESILTSIIDQPGPGYFWYILELEFIDNSGGNIVTNCILKQRSFAAQVLKT